MARNLERFPSTSEKNSLWSVYDTVSFFKVARNFIVISLARITPFMRWKLWMLRLGTGMKIGKYSSFALMSMPDTMFPERITVGENCIIGYNATILAHEYLIDEYRVGDVIIEDNVLLGANCTVLPGVVIGEGAIVAAGAVVHRDVEPYTLVAGNPMQVVRNMKKE
ncbi:MAG: acyltransferase [Bacilli bacterium]